MTSTNSPHTSLTSSSCVLDSPTATTASSSRLQTFQAQNYQHLLHKTRLKLKDSTAISLTKMDPYNPQYQGNNSGQSSSGSKGKTNDPGVLDGLLPRIETRGQSRGGSSKSGGQKDKGSTNSYW